jgi:hypothetical protein
MPAFLAASISSSSSAAYNTINDSTPLRQRAFRYFRTLRNIFGLSRKYYGTNLSSHDPEQHVTVQDLCEAGASASPSARNVNAVLSNQPFYPYPNESSFSLGDWYWNQGLQKTQEGFSKLLNIVGSPDFLPSDVSSTNWTKINTILAHNGDDNDTDFSREWLGEDMGWKRTAISISVPFHRRMAVPGSKSYLAGALYHRSIVSVIRERLTNDDKHFHYEPYEQLWKGNDDAEEVRIHGELYTSNAFLSEHKKLLNSPPESGCDAPRAIAALMFWSDGTQLTSFGNAKLWPCYMYFGNDSKYQRAKPSSRLCNHIAYFQTVSFSIQPTAYANILIFFSSPTRSKNLPLRIRVVEVLTRSSWPIATERCSTNSGKFFLMMNFWQPMNMAY